MFEPVHKRDFDAVYNVRTPHEYYRGLQPTGYRMPEVIADTLRLLAPRFRAEKLADNDLSVVDFACGYGAIGALLRHRLSMQEVFAYYANDKAALSRAEAWLSARALALPGITLTGLDIADNALRYAEELGFVDAAFAEDLVAEEPSPELRETLARAHLIVESGGVDEIQATVFERILAAEPRPWILRSPRPDVDWTIFDTVFAGHDYV